MSDSRNIFEYNDLFMSVLFYFQLVRKDMYVNEHPRLSNMTQRHQSKYRNNAFIVVLYSKSQ